MRGVNGWLAFLVASLAVLTPLAAIVSAAADIGHLTPGLVIPGARRALVWFDVIEAMLVIAACGYLAWRLAKVHRWSSVRIAVAGFWLIAAVPLVAEIVAVAAAFGLTPTRVAAAVVGRHVRAAIWAAIWTAYLLRSVRVANTYPRLAPDQQLAAVFE